MSRGFRRSNKLKAPDRARGRRENAAESGLFSQSQVLHLMHTELARARRHGIAVSCLLMQADRIPIEDVRPAALEQLRDALRSELGALVREKTRGHDHVGMLEDDRYVLMLPHTDVEQALRVAGRIASAFGDLEILGPVGEASFQPTLSVGVVYCDDPDVLFFETILRRAEIALERAQAAGGDRCTVYGSPQDPDPEDPTRLDEDPAGRRREDDRDHPR
jgi:diguanylate cyclase (GGDEF)-like protein